MKDAIIQFYHQRRGLTIGADNIVVSSGAKQSLFQVRTSTTASRLVIDSSQPV
jgi:aspartate/methionine/tyrosine aminotransferase